MRAGPLRGFGVPLAENFTRGPLLMMANGARAGGSQLGGCGGAKPPCVNPAGGLGGVQGRSPWELSNFGGLKPL